MPSIETIIAKLGRHNLVERTQTGSRGEFSLKDHGMLLNKEELDYWLSMIHEGSSECKKECNDVHVWGFELAPDLSTERTEDEDQLDTA